MFIIKFPYNAHSDWLKQRTLSENKEQVNDIKEAFKFLLRNFDKFGVASQLLQALNFFGGDRVAALLF